MPRIKRYTLLEYIPNKFLTEKSINSARIYNFNDKKLKKGPVVYLCTREFRYNDNFALQFVFETADKLNEKVKIIFPKIDFEHKPKQLFLEKQFSYTEKILKNLNIDFEVLDIKEIQNYLYKDITCLITDFNPIIKKDYLKEYDFKIFEIDGHNIVPARILSNKQEYNAATFRNKIYHSIYPFLTEFQNNNDFKTEADIVLADFIKNKLPYYKEFRNNPAKEVLSGLSKYINLGFISAQKVALEIIKSNVTKENKEDFLEEFIVRRELADNFCLYCKNFKTLKCTPSWAKESVEKHRNNLRSFIYEIEILEKSLTKDILWNACQNQLLQEGTIHSYLRMYWAKKILEWSPSAESAIKTAIFLNDKYAYDAPSTNGYVGILWSIAGLHDRAFQDWPVTGKIRRMTFNSIQKKFDIKNYIEKYSTL